MTSERPPAEPPDPKWVRRLIVAVPVAVALVSAKPYAGGWNDGSRLAVVESIADHGTFIIDDSVFVRVPEELIERGIPPFDPAMPLLLRHGTLDKLFIDGHFYSDKPPVPSVLLAGVYRGWQTLGGPRFADRPAVAIYWMTVFTSGLAYILAVWGWDRLGRLRGWPRTVRLTLLLGFALGTVAVPYAQHVNAHEMLLGVMAAVMLQMERIRRAMAENGRVVGKMMVMGTLGGFGYTLDPGLAPGLALSVFGWAVFRVRQWHPVLMFALAALPWVIAHHALNRHLGGGWVTPMNAIPAYFDYPGGPFNAANITGAWRHTPASFVKYLGDLFFGKQGFLTHNLPMMLAVFCVPIMAWRKRLTAEHVAGLVFVIFGSLCYAALSTNRGGAGCSVRWFVPFLAVGFVVIGEYLTWRPEHLREQRILTAGGLALGACMWWAGPWTFRLIPFFWPIMLTTITAFAVSGFARRRV